MNDIISLLIELKSQARVAQELMVNSDFEGPDWKKLTYALECIDRVNSVLDEVLGSRDSEQMTEERVTQIKKYQKAPFVPDFIGSLWDENDNIATEEAI